VDLTAAVANLGLDADRTRDPASFAIGGRTPRIAARPASREEAAEALRAAAREGLRVVPWGGGVALPFESAPEHYDVALDLGGLDRVVEYEPDDLTLTAECGVTLGSLRAKLAERGQELPIEGARATRATLGGAIAANAVGPRRRAFGAPRDRVLGARYLLGDGTTARSGGKVVKNVAGYGVHRLLCGSRGGLAIVLEASLKLQPAPEQRVGLVFAATERDLADGARWRSLARLELAALTVVSTTTASGIHAAGTPFLVVAGCEGDTAWVAEQERHVCAALGLPLAKRTGAEAVELWTKLEDLEEQSGERLTLVTADCTPDALERVNAFAPGIPLAFHVLAGRLMLWPRGGEAEPLLPMLLHDGGWVVVDARPTSAFGLAKPKPPAVLAMRAALREAIDPTRRFALGEDWVERSL